MEAFETTLLENIKRVSRPSSSAVSNRATIVLFCLNECLPEERKWVSHQVFCLMYWNRTNVPTSLGRVNPNTAAAGYQTRHLALHQAAKRTQSDWNSVCPRGTRVCAPPLVKSQVQCGPSAGHFEPLGGSLSTSHPQIPPSQQLGLQSPPRTPG